MAVVSQEVVRGLRLVNDVDWAIHSELQTQVSRVHQEPAGRPIFSGVKHEAEPEGFKGEREGRN